VDRVKKAGGGEKGKTKAKTFSKKAPFRGGRLGRREPPASDNHRIPPSPAKIEGRKIGLAGKEVEKKLHSLRGGGDSTL